MVGFEGRDAHKDANLFNVICTDHLPIKREISSRMAVLLPV